jgi:hypothetical protein
LLASFSSSMCEREAASHGNTNHEGCKWDNGRGFGGAILMLNSFVGFLSFNSFSKVLRKKRGTHLFLFDKWAPGPKCKQKKFEH